MHRSTKASLFASLVFVAGLSACADLGEDPMLDAELEFDAELDTADPLEASELGLEAPAGAEQTTTSAIVFPPDCVEVDLADYTTSVQIELLVSGTQNQWAVSLDVVDVTNGAATPLLQSVWVDTGKAKPAYDLCVTGTSGEDLMILENDTGGITYALAGSGSDTIYGSSGEDHLDGGKQHDEIHGGEGDDLILGQQGTDYLYGEGGFDEIHGGRGSDFIWGGDQPDKLYGDEHDDEILGGDGGDALFGGSGLDVLLGEEGNDGIYGDGINVGSDGGNLCDGGIGHDFGMCIDTDLIVSIEWLV